MTRLTPDWLFWPEIETLTHAFKQANAPLRFVGGAVRDALVGKPVSDVDAATTLLPEQTLKLLEAARIRAIPTGLAHGTITALIDGRSFEITTLRRDEATDGRHAEVAYTDSWEEDAKRRDFTMNALYLAPSGELFDYFEGEADARAGVVRFIGDPRERIAEDYLRILRFFRFLAHYGRQAPDAEALDACAELSDGIAALSGERITQEMLKLLAADTASSVLAIMRLQGILPLLMLKGDRLNIVHKLDIIHATAPLKLAALEGEQLVDRWRLSGQMRTHLALWRKYAGQITPDLPLNEQKKIIRHIGFASYSQAVKLSFAAGSYAWQEYTRLLTLENWEAPQFPVSGNDLKTLGIDPGPAMGEALARLEMAWEESDYTMSKEALLGLV